MEIKLAKSAGFCFGGEACRRYGLRAGTKREERLDAGEEQVPDIYTFGPVIHNEEVVKDLKKKRSESTQDRGGTENPGRRYCDYPFSWSRRTYLRDDPGKGFGIYRYDLPVCEENT